MLKTLQELQKLLHIDYSPLFTEFIRWLPRLFSGIILFIIFWFVYRGLRFFMIRTLARLQISLTIIELLTKTLKYFLFSLALLMMANQWGIEIVPLLSTLGIVGIAIGLAAQQTLANLISGMIILISKPFQEGDWVELEQTFGKIFKISLRSTQLMTIDNLLIDIPNQKIVESKIVNHTFNKQIRLRVAVSIPYKESIARAREVLLQIVKGDTRLLTQPPPNVVVTGLGDSGVNLELQVWLENAELEIPLGYELRQKIKSALDAAGIEIPFPHQQIYIENIRAQGLEPLLKQLA
ncbi:mechanosensitive ion channel family protein [candidate division KSB1 bacterium]|nr:mechanosensitive ion channel family protein [candidate division KSB1 bacterium]